MLVDQLPHRLAGPQRRRNRQLLRTSGVDRLLDALFMLSAKPASGTDRPTGTIPGQGGFAALPVLGAPAGDGLRTHVENGGNVVDGIALFPSTHRTQA